MWMQVKAGPASPCFTRELYEGMKRRGLLLDDFLEEQLRALREQRPEAVGSGLVLDLLFFHTTPLATAESRSAAEVAERYGHRPEVPELVEHCKDRYLLADGGGDGAAEAADRPTTRLAHDTLAPLVRRRFESSDLPGQRAQRILQRAEEWTGGRSGETLGKLDLARVEEGKAGMRARTPDEERLAEAVQTATLTEHSSSVVAASFSPDGARVVTASADRTARIWNAATGQPIVTLTGHTDQVWAASFSPDGTRVVTASARDLALAVDTLRDEIHLVRKEILAAMGDL